MLEILLDHKPRVIGLDIYRNIPVPPGSEKLAELFSRTQNIVTVKKLGDEKSPGIDQPYMVKDTSLVGSNDIVVDSEGIVRRGLLFLDDGKDYYYSFALLVASLYLKAEGIEPQPDPLNPEFMKLGKTAFIPLESDDGGYIGADSRGYQFLLDFSGAGTVFSSVSMSDILLSRSRDKYPEPAMLEKIQNKIVIIGSTAESLKDFFFIPFTRPGEPGQTIAGVEIHACIVSQLLCSALDGSGPLVFFREVYEWAWIMLWSMVGYLAGLYIRSFWRFVLSNFGFIIILSGITSIAFKKGLWIPTVPPAIACLVTAVLVTIYLSYQEKIQKTILMQLFSSHVSKAVAETIWKQRKLFIKGGRLRPQKITATVLFTDLKGFTTVSENMEPQAIMEWLNEYMEAMVKVIMNHEGVVSKFIGDAVMALFGAPVARTDESEINRDAVNAVKCAIAMGKELERLNSIWTAQNRPAAKMRVGIFTGPLVVGSLGSAQRQEYTVIGDTVNVAARLESFDKTLDAENTCRILIGENTFHRLDHNQFHMKKLTGISLKGKVQSLNIYQVMYDWKLE